MAAGRDASFCPRLIPHAVPMRRSRRGLQADQAEIYAELAAVEVDNFIRHETGFEPPLPERAAAAVTSIEGMYVPATGVAHGVGRGVRMW